MKLKIIPFLLSILIFFIGFGFGWYIEKIIPRSEEPLEKVVESLPIEKPYEVYSIEALKSYVDQEGKIEITKEIDNTEDYVSSEFSLTFQPKPDEKTTKKTTGMLNIPKKEGTFPLIVMFRGYADKSIYQTGVGTRNAGYYFAKNGFITLAPDFLGYADSDIESSNIYEARFQTYTTALATLASIDQIKEWDRKNIFIWAHSNGGQIALTTLSIVENSIPTVLWAPVTKPFPYSVLYYTDESPDGGKFIRRELAKFESLYDTDKYSFRNYIDKINAPLQFHQGTSDLAVPFGWTAEMNYLLKTKEKETEYFQYAGADHNLRPDWDSAVERSLEFYKEHLQE